MALKKISSIGGGNGSSSHIGSIRIYRIHINHRDLHFYCLSSLAEHADVALTYVASYWFCKLLPEEVRQSRATSLKRASRESIGCFRASQVRTQLKLQKEQEQ